MTQTSSRLFDELAKLMTDAAGAAKGVRSEVEGVMRAQAEKILNELDVVSREEFEAVKAMAQKAREENDALAARVAALEGTGTKAQPAAAKRRSTRSTAKKTAATKKPAARAKRSSTRQSGKSA